MPVSMKDLSVVQNGNIIEVHGKSYSIREDLKKRGARWNPEHKVWYFTSSTAEKVTQIIRDITGEEGDLEVQPKLSFQLDTSRNSTPPEHTSQYDTSLDARPPRTSDYDLCVSRNSIQLTTTFVEKPMMNISEEQTTKPFRDMQKNLKELKKKQEPSVKYEDIRITLRKARIKWETYMKELGKRDQVADTMGCSVKVYYIGQNEKEAKYHILIKYLDSSLIKYAEKIKLYVEGKGYKVMHVVGNKIV
jgi:hypothetical protein